MLQHNFLKKFKIIFKKKISSINVKIINTAVMSNFDLQKKSVNARFLDFFFAQVAGVHLCILMFAEIAVTFKTRWLIFHVKEAVPRKLYYFCIFPTKIFCCNILGYKKIEKESYNKINAFFYYSLFHKNLKSDTTIIRHKV